MGGLGPSAGETFDHPRLSLTLRALLLTIVMRLAKRLYVCGIEPKPAISAMRNNVITDVANWLGHAALGAGKDYLSRRHTEHAKVTQAEHTMRMVSQVTCPEALPVSTVSARSASLPPCPPRWRLDDLRTRLKRSQSRSECGQSGHKKNARYRRSGAG